MADNKTPDVPPIPVPPVEAAPKVAKAPAKAPAAKKPAAAAAPIPPLVDLAGGTTAPAAAQPNPYAQAPAAQPDPYAQAAPGQPQPYNYGPYVPQPPKGLSITSMILGIAGLVFAFFPANVAAVITGHMASKSQPYAKPFWLTGIITGYVGLGVSLLVGLIILASIFIPLIAIGTYGGYGTYGY